MLPHLCFAIPARPSHLFFGTRNPKLETQKAKVKREIGMAGKVRMFGDANDLFYGPGSEGEGDTWQ